MDLAGNAAGDAAAAGAATVATNKALQLPPNTKNTVIEAITSAQESLATIVTALQDAEEAEGAAMPEELPSAIDQVGMALCALAGQFAPQSEAGPPVAMSAAEVEIANALADGAPEIAKSILGMSGGNSVKKATTKIAPAHVVSLIKELLDDFVGRASKWGNMFTGDAPAQAAPAAAAAAPAAKNTDARATLKNVATQATGRVNKALGAETTTTPAAAAAAALDMVAITKALQTIPDLAKKLASLEKSFVGGGIGDPLDEPANNGAGDGNERAFEPGENISARVRKALARGEKKNRRDEEDDDFDV